MRALGKRIVDSLNVNAHSRFPDFRRDEAYTRSYRVIRLAVGLVHIHPSLIFYCE